LLFKEPASNCELVGLLRTFFRLANAAFLVTLHWVKGHSEVGGNHRVDLLSKFFATHERELGPHDSAYNLSSYATHKRSWRFGFPLSSVPIHLFKPVAESPCGDHWTFGDAFLSSTYSALPLSPAVPRKRKGGDEALNIHSKRISSVLSVPPSPHSSYYDTESETLDFKHDCDPAFLQTPIDAVALASGSFTVPVSSAKAKRKSQ